MIASEETIKELLNKATLLPQEWAVLENKIAMLTTEQVRALAKTGEAVKFLCASIINKRGLETL